MIVSIIMAAHNASVFVGTAINSVQQQTFTDWELIVVDDGSHDDTASKVMELSVLDSRIILIRHKESRGVSAARNTALSRAIGKWVAILDADDAFENTRLETLIKIAEKRQLDILIDNLLVINFESSVVMGLAFNEGWMTAGENYDLAKFLSRDWPGRFKCFSIGTSKPLIRRGILAQHDVRYDD